MTRSCSIDHATLSIVNKATNSVVETYACESESGYAYSRITHPYTFKLGNYRCKWTGTWTDKTSFTAYEDIKVRKETRISVKSEFTKTCKNKKQSFNLGVKTNGDGKLIYKLSSSKVKVSSSGKVTIAKGFLGRADISISAKGTSKYSSDYADTRIFVYLAKPKLKSVASPGKGELAVTWKAVAKAEKYLVCVSTDSDFENERRVDVNKSKTSLRISGCPSGKYYVRVCGVNKNDLSEEIRYSSVRSVKVK